MDSYVTVNDLRCNWGNEYKCDSILKWVVPVYNYQCFRCRNIHLHSVYPSQGCIIWCVTTWSDHMVSNNLKIECHQINSINTAMSKSPGTLIQGDVKSPKVACNELGPPKMTTKYTRTSKIGYHWITSFRVMSKPQDHPQSTYSQSSLSPTSPTLIHFHWFLFYFKCSRLCYALILATNSNKLNFPIKGSKWMRGHNRPPFEGSSQQTKVSTASCLISLFSQKFAASWGYTRDPSIICKTSGFKGHLRNAQWRLTRPWIAQSQREIQIYI